MVDFKASMAPAQRQPAEDGADDAGEQRAERSDLGRRRDAGVEQDEHQHDQQEARPDAHEAGPALLPRGRDRSSGACLGLITDPDDRHGREQDADDDARDDAGDQQLADRGLGRDAVDHHRDARRDQDVERRADADRARRQLVRIAVAAHFRHRDLRHHRGGRHARAGHGAEDAAGEHGGDGEPAPDVRAASWRRRCRDRGRARSRPRSTPSG